MLQVINDRSWTVHCKIEWHLSQHGVIINWPDCLQLFASTWTVVANHPEHQPAMLSIPVCSKRYTGCVSNVSWSTACCHLASATGIQQDKVARCISCHCDYLLANCFDMLSDITIRGIFLRNEWISNPRVLWRCDMRLWVHTHVS